MSSNLLELLVATHTDVPASDVSSVTRLKSYRSPFDAATLSLKIR